MKKNTLLKITAIVIPIILIGVMIYFFTNYQKKKKAVEALQSIPAFSLKTIGGETFTQKDLGKTQNKILVYFSPTCHYCQAEAEELSKIHQKHNDIEWVWIASEPLEEIKTFAKTYQLENVENIKWCYDKNATLYQAFAMTSVPYFLAYDKTNQLKFRNKGAIKLEKIVAALHEGK